MFLWQGIEEKEVSFPVLACEGKRVLEMYVGFTFPGFGSEGMGGAAGVTPVRRGSGCLPCAGLIAEHS